MSSSRRAGFRCRRGAMRWPMPSILPSFRVDVDQFARMFAFVADDGRPDLESRQSAKPAAAQNKSNRRDRPPHLPGYRGPGQALAAQSLDLVFSRRRQPGRARARTRRAIHQAGPPDSDPAICAPSLDRPQWQPRPRQLSSQLQGVRSSAFDYAAWFWHSHECPSGAPR